jgi:hypothetical protein
MSFFHDPIIRNRSRIALALLLLAVIGGFMWLALRPSEPDPVYKGKRLSDWLSYYDTPALDLDTMADLIRTSTSGSESYFESAYGQCRQPLPQQYPRLR